MSKSNTAPDSHHITRLVDFRFIIERIRDFDYMCQAITSQGYLESVERAPIVVRAALI